MNPYPKINSLFKRDMNAPKKPFIFGEFCEPEVEYLKNNKWEATEKVDGTNIRVMWDGAKVSFAGKSDNAQIPPHLLARLNELFPNEKMTSIFDAGAVCLYGEGFGYKIQGKVGVDYLKGGVDFYLFDVKIGDWWLKRDAVAEIASKLNILPPHVVGYMTIWEAIEFVKSGFPSHFGDAMAEGLVLRPQVELFNRKEERIITKVKVVDFK